MQLYYTTSTGYQDAQTTVIRSLGGYRASTIVKNNDFGNLFAEISLYTIRENRDEYIALILRNTTGATVTNVRAWFVLPTSNYGIFEIAAVTTTNDADGNPMIERTRTRFTQPFIGTFSVPTSASPLVIGSMTNGQEIGLWIKRRLNLTAIDAVAANLYERDPTNNDIYRSVVHDLVENVTLSISYNN